MEKGRGGNKGEVRNAIHVLGSSKIGSGVKKI